MNLLAMRKVELIGRNNDICAYCADDFFGRRGGGGGSFSLPFTPHIKFPGDCEG